jgi:hypothetical protein
MDGQSQDGDRSVTAKGECHGAASASESCQSSDSYQKGHALLSDEASHLRHTPGSICSSRCDELYCRTRVR